MCDKRLYKEELDVQLNLKLIESLRSSEEKYRSLVNNLNQVVFQLNLQGEFVFLNETWESYTGISSRQAQNSFWLDYFDFRDRALAASHFEKTFQQHAPIRFECRLLSKELRQIIVEVCLLLLPDIDGKRSVIGTLFDITQYKKNLQQISISNSRLFWALQGANDGYWDWNIENNYVFYSPRWKSMLGFDADEPLRAHLDTWYELVHPKDQKISLLAAEKYLAGKTDKFEVEFRMLHKDGFWVDILSRGSIATNQQGEPVSPRRLIGTHVDISERKQNEQKLLTLQKALEATANAVIIASPEGKIEWSNPAFSVLTGYSHDEILGKKPKQLIFSGIHEQSFYREMWQTIQSNQVWKGDLVNKRKDGSLYDEHMTITPITDQKGRILHYIAIKEDISNRKAAEREINELAFYDPLTKLPNRRLFLERLKQALADCQRDKGYAALLFIDLDNFKSINDTYGHDCGDSLLVEAAERIALCVRTNDTVARLGGDEFVVMLKQLEENEGVATAVVQRLGDKVLSALSKPYLINGLSFYSSSSIGVCMFTDQYQRAEDILKRADTAMYEAKFAGRNTLRFFDPAMQKAVMERLQIEKELRQAIEKKQFKLFYQVQVDDHHQVVGMEALIRWQHPKKGLIGPDLFLEVAEQSGILLNIGEWVINSGLKQLQCWQASEKTRHLTLSLNISAIQFKKPSFVDNLKAAIRKYKVDCDGLMLELTESTLINDSDTINKINALKNNGVKLSMDDFGTGYSSLSYLKRFNLSQLKIDRLFVRDMLNNQDDHVLVKTIITMGKNLGLDIVAEGVENRRQFELLRNNDCLKFQGFWINRPCPAGEINEYLGVC